MPQVEKSSATMVGATAVDGRPTGDRLNLVFDIGCPILTTTLTRFLPLAHVQEFYTREISGFTDMT